MSLLGLAALHDDVAMVAELLEAGCDPGYSGAKD